MAISCLLSLCYHAPVSEKCKLFKSIFKSIYMDWDKSKKSVVAGTLLFLPLIDCYLKTKAAKELELPVYKKLLKGSKSKVPLDPITQVIP